MRKYCEICRGERDFSDGDHCRGCGSLYREPVRPVVDRHVPERGSCVRCTSKLLVRNSQYQHVCVGCGEVQPRHLPERPVVIGDGLWLFRFMRDGVERVVRLRVSGGWIIECPAEFPEWRNRQVSAVVATMRATIRRAR